MRVLVGILLIIVNSITVAYELRRPPRCIVTGVEVQHIFVKKEFLWERGIMLGMSQYINPHNQVIFLDYENLKLFPPIFQQWVAEHECSHIRLGHTKMFVSPAFNRNVVTKQEKQADCDAIKQLVKKGITEEEKTILFRSMINERNHKIANQGVLPVANLDQRVQHIKQCLEVKNDH